MLVFPEESGLIQRVDNARKQTFVQTAHVQFKFVLKVGYLGDEDMPIATHLEGWSQRCQAEGRRCHNACLFASNETMSIERIQDFDQYFAR